MGHTLKWGCLPVLEFVGKLILIVQFHSTLDEEIVYFCNFMWLFNLIWLEVNLVIMF